MHKFLTPLFLMFLIIIFTGGCAQKNNISTIQKQSKYNVDTLLKAVKDGDITTVAKHLQAKLDINTKDSKGNALLHLAVISQNDKMLSFLLNNGATIDILNEKGMSALQLAVEANAQSTITDLLINGANTTIVNLAGDAAIHTATKANFTVVVNMLLKHEASNLELTNKEGLTPLLVASASGHLKLIKSFLKSHADLNASTIIGLNILQVSMRSNSLQTVDFLVKKGLKLTQLSSAGQTLLHLSAEAGSVKIAKYLVKKGLKVGSKDNNKMLAIDYAVDNSHPSMVSFLLTKFSKLSNAYQLKLLRKAIRSKDSKTLIALHKGGVSLNTLEFKTGASVLHYAVTLDDMDAIITTILKHTKLITHEDKKGKTALDYAKTEKKPSYIATMKPFYLKVKIAYLIKKDDFPGLKALRKKYPEVIDLIKNKRYKLALDGPVDLMIGDLKILSRKGRSQAILIAQIKRLKTAYRHFSSSEIGTLVAYGLPTPIISAIINKSAELEKEALIAKERQALKTLQTALLQTAKLSLVNQSQAAKFQEITNALVSKMIKKQVQMIEEQMLTTQALKKAFSVQVTREKIASDEVPIPLVEELSK